MSSPKTKKKARTRSKSPVRSSSHSGSVHGQGMSSGMGMPAAMPMGSLAPQVGYQLVSSNANKIVLRRLDAGPLAQGSSGPSAMDVRPQTPSDEPDEEVDDAEEQEAPRGRAQLSRAALLAAQKSKSAKGSTSGKSEMTVEDDGDGDGDDDGDDETPATPAAAAASDLTERKKPKDETQSQSSRGRLRPASRIELTGQTKIMNTISSSIKRIQAAAASQTKSGELFPYDMDGEMSATTTAKAAGHKAVVRSTTDNQHSEMCAVEDMLTPPDEMTPAPWQLVNGQIVTQRGSNVAPKDFATPAPHCGCCTIMLTVLGLPLTKPTAGRHQMLAQGGPIYPVPDAIKRDKDVILRLLNGGKGRGDVASSSDSKDAGYDKPLHDILNVFFPGQSQRYSYDELWGEVMKRDDMLDAIWGAIREAIRWNVS